MLIPIPLAAAHASFLAWLSRTGDIGEFSPGMLTDQELGELRAVVVEMYDDVRNGLARVDSVVAKRAMAAAHANRTVPGASPPGQSSGAAAVGSEPAAPGAVR